MERSLQDPLTPHSETAAKDEKGEKHCQFGNGRYIVIIVGRRVVLPILWARHCVVHAYSHVILFCIVLK